MYDDLRTAEFGFPGQLRDQLVATILDGRKTSTTGLLQDFEIEGTPLEPVGERSVVIDSAGVPVAVIELTEIAVCRMDEIDLPHALDEGEGYASVADWRAGHENFWHSPEYRDWLGDPAFTVDDATMTVKQRFRLVEIL
jgi:uncharacterized protein YhfF